jgi:hypothetical protein
VDKERLRKLKQSWHRLNSEIKTLTEEELIFIINAELDNPIVRRDSIIERCFSRYIHLRNDRERDQLKRHLAKGGWDGRSFQEITKFEGT